MPHSNPLELGAHWLRKNRRWIDRCLEFRKNNDEMFMDIGYRELISDPLFIARKIYEDLNLTWTDEHTRMTTEFITAHQKNKYGKHLYALENYGLSASMVEMTFSKYLREYKSFIEVKSSCPAEI